MGSNRMPSITQLTLKYVLLLFLSHSYSIFVCAAKVVSPSIESMLHACIASYNNSIQEMSAMIINFHIK